MKEALDDRNCYDDRRAPLARLIQELRAVDSWTGETHIHKSTFYLQELFGCDMGYGFYLHHYGPYCSDIREVMQFMMMFGEIKPTHVPNYRPKYNVTDRGVELAETDLGTKYAKQIEWISVKIGKLPAGKLEGPSTALLLTKRQVDLGDKGRPNDHELIASEIHRLKPHISILDAHRAIDDLAVLKADAQESKLIIV